MPKILYIQYTNPAGYPPLQHSSRILAGKGWDVLFLGTGALGADNLVFPEHPKIRVQKLPFCAGGWKQKIHYLFYVCWTMWNVVWFRPRWVYASDPLSCPLALILKCPGFKVIYHEHDSPQDEFKKSFFQKMVLWARKRLAKHANLCVLPNEKRLEQFKFQTGAQKNVICVWNCPSRDEVLEKRLPYEKGPLRLLYQGSVVPDRLPISVLQALAKLSTAVELDVIGYETIGHLGYIQQLQREALRLGLQKRLNLIGTVPHCAELFRRSRSCDIGLALMPKNVSDANLLNMTGASNKSFDYLACGLALLVSDLPDWQEMFVKPGYGLACNPDDPESIAAALRWFLDHPKEMREMGERGRQRILEEWNYENQFSPVLKKLNGNI